MDFSYIDSLHIYDCYAYRDFRVPIGKGVEKPFRHLILTGKNGSGKTTILKQLDVELHRPKEGHKVGKRTKKVSSQAQIGIEPTDILGQPLPTIGLSGSIYSFFNAQRQTKIGSVSSPISDQEFEKRASEKGISGLLKQFLVNKKINQVFATIEKNGEAKQSQERFFEKLNDLARSVFNDPNLNIIFKHEAYEFYVQLSDGREFTFEQLSDGFSAFVGILLEMLAKVDRVQSKAQNFSLDPPGIVLIDEPETHLHLEMQYHVMPLLTGLFPNVQFIVATHSPAIASSIKDAVVFDLTTKKLEQDWVVGSSYAELMQTHFGLENGYSDITDGIIENVQAIVDSSDTPQTKLERLRQLLSENKQYLSLGFHLSIETKILKLEKEIKMAKVP